MIWSDVHFESFVQAPWIAEQNVKGIVKDTWPCPKPTNHIFLVVASWLDCGTGVLQCRLGYDSSSLQEDAGEEEEAQRPPIALRSPRSSRSLSPSMPPIMEDTSEEHSAEVNFILWSPQGGPSKQACMTFRTCRAACATG